MPRSRRLSTSSAHENIERVKKIVLDNPHSSLREIARDLEISHESVRLTLVHTLGMRRVATRLAPKKLNFLQKLYVSLHMLDRVSHANKLTVIRIEGKRRAKTETTTSKFLKSQGDGHCFHRYLWFGAPRICFRELNGQ